MSKKPRQEYDGPSHLKAEGPANERSLEDIGQPTHTKNAQEVMEQHFDHPKKHPL